MTFTDQPTIHLPHVALDPADPKRRSILEHPSVQAAARYSHSRDFLAASGMSTANTFKGVELSLLPPQVAATLTLEKEVRELERQVCTLSLCTMLAFPVDKDRRLRSSDCRVRRSLSWKQSQRASREHHPLPWVSKLVFITRPPPQRLRPNRSGTRMHSFRTLVAWSKRLLTCTQTQIDGQ